MKRIFLTFLCGLPITYAFSQTNTFPTTGSAGIGTLTPESFLHVIGASGSTAELKADHYFNNFGASTLQMRKSRGTKASPVIVADGDYIGSLETWGYAGTAFRRNSYIGSFVNGTPTATGIPTDLIFATSSGGNDALEGMRLDKNGNLGIGTSAPTEKLSVKGKIRAQEIKVEINNWPDFVFAKDYKLLTLQETEKHIKEKGHLPGIPSAAEVEKNGIELGDMNKKLLQKIEELTLYLIEQNRFIVSQEKRIVELEKRK
ncbi:MAG TPA: hypothetical protein VK541_22070 [Pedobacter sp.]|uniref:hypothetical protein n=1 Tax=Pedobacter sp. TaxID=1411316 RepID=UPI002B83A9EC|nr:hypothetical protein [Pedobacter sp.]HMI05190.1 hypothetical protein [Pedobacter sp.]